MLTVRELRGIQERIEEWVLKTPTGDIRNLLTDCRIVVDRAIEVATSDGRRGEF